MVNLIFIKYKRSWSCIYYFFKINQGLMTSIVFPGQGSQYLGMAKDFYDNFQIAKKVFEEIEDYTGINLKNIIFENENNLIDSTKYTQISIFTASVAIFKTLVAEGKLDLLSIDTVLGHSLGEYSALACSDKLSLKDCSLILKKRGELMNDAVQPNTTGMAALIGKDVNEVEKIINENNLNIQIANDNSPLQVVISGNKDELINSKDTFIQNNIKKYVELNVSAAFHSSHMLNAQNILSAEISKLNFNDNKINIISNYNAKISNNIAEIKISLQNQMSNRVRWAESIKKLESTGEIKIIEIGPSKVLSGLIKRISNSFDITSINTIEDIDTYE